MFYFSHSQALSSRHLEVKVSMYKSDFILGPGISWAVAHYFSLAIKMFSLFARLGSYIIFLFEEQIPLLYKIWPKDFIPTSW